MIKTGVWKEIQIEFHNFKVIEQLGMKFPTENSKHKKRYIKVECKLCGLQYEGQYALFKNRDKVCKCETKKGKGMIAWATPTRDRLIKIRTGMIYRCHNSKSPNFIKYGGRGIYVCLEWRNNFEEFYQWALNNGYEHGLTIERIDNDKGYNPNNCCWISRSDQAKNKRNVFKPEEVEKIKDLLSKGMRHKVIADIMNCKMNRIARISCKMTWE